MSGIVLSLCDKTGNMVQPWIEAGYEAITVDLQEAKTGNKARHHFVADMDGPSGARTPTKIRLATHDGDTSR